MIRKRLAAINEVRATFRATFERTGLKHGRRKHEKTLLFVCVLDVTGQMLTDHLWFNATRGFERLQLGPADKVQFDARVKRYLKGSPMSYDYKLSHPTKILKLYTKATIKLGVPALLHYLVQEG